MQRRTFVTLVGGSASIGLAGCLSDDGNDDDNPGIIANHDEFRAESSQNATRAEHDEGGIVWVDEPNREDALANALSLPPAEEIPNPVVIEAEVHDDGTWESTALEFPPIALSMPEMDIQTDIQVEAPEGFSGEYDEENRRWTVEGLLRMTLETEDGEGSLDFPLEATTGTSGDLDGSFERTDDSVLATIVDNESTVDIQPPIEPCLFPPCRDGGDFEGDNWFSLTFELEPI